MLTSTAPTCKGKVAPEPCWRLKATFSQLFHVGQAGPPGGLLLGYLLMQALYLGQPALNQWQGCPANV